MRNEVTPFDEWCRDAANVPQGDPVWRLPAYQLAMYCSEIAWQDVSALARRPVTAPLAPQLYRALGSIGANLSEGYSRSSGRDRVRLYEYSLGSARESVVWYHLARPILGEDTVRHRTETLQRIVRMSLIAIPRERHLNLGRDPVDRHRP